MKGKKGRKILCDAILSIMLNRKKEVGERKRERARERLLKQLVARCVLLALAMPPPVQLVFFNIILVIEIGLNARPNCDLYDPPPHTLYLF